MNPIRVWAMARHGFLELLRERLLYLAGLFGVLLIAGAALIRQFTAVAEAKILLDFGMGAISLISLVIVLFTAPGLVGREIDKRTIHILVAKPISRAEFIVAKLLGLMAALALLVAVMAGLFLGFLTLSRFSFPAGPLLVSWSFLMLELALLTAAALLFSVFTSPLIATFLTLATFLIGHLSSDIVTLGRLVHNEQVVQFLRNLYLVVPDLSRLDLKNQAVYGVLPDGMTLASNALYGSLYTLLLLSVTLMVFARREF